MKEIELLRRTHVNKIGVCEAKSKTHCDDDTAEYLVKSKHAKYVSVKDSAAAAKALEEAEKETKKA
jgi:hypothetical protein